MKVDVPRKLKEAAQDERLGRAFLRNLRWPDGFVCPQCGHREGHEVVRGKFWACSAPHCRFRTCPRVGTFLEGSRKPIRLWLKALHLFLKSQRGLTAVELQKEMGCEISTPTAWAWLHHFRRSLRHDTALRRLIPKPSGPAIPRRAKAWGGTGFCRSAIAFLRSRFTPTERRVEAFAQWLLRVYGARVSAKHLEGYWLEFYLRAFREPDRACSFFSCLGSSPLFSVDVSSTPVLVRGRCP